MFETVLILRKTERDIAIYVRRSWQRERVTLVRLYNITWISSTCCWKIL